MTPTRVAFWGLGRHASAKLLPAAAATPGLEIAGACSRDAARVAGAAIAWRCRGWTDPAEMLADPRVDVVYVATPIALHAEHGRRVLEAGKHLWCEKPLSGDRAECASLLDLSRARNLVLCEGFMHLRHPQFEQLRAWVSSGELGRLTSIVCRFGIPRLDEPGFRAHADLGGGALLDVGCYTVATLVALLPERVLRVRSASIETRGDWMVDTDGDALIDCDGTAAYLDWRINASYRSEVDVWGDEGSVFTDKIFSKPAAYEPTFRRRDARGAETILRGRAADHFVLMLQDFRRIMDDPAAAERERGGIAARAALLHEIRARAAAHDVREG